MHITLCQKIIAKHRSMRKVSVSAARDDIGRLALYANTHAETREDLALRGHLERATGLPIAQLHELAQSWPDV